MRSDHRVEVEPIVDRSLPSLVTRVGGFTTEVRMYAGQDCLMLNLGARGQYWHLFDWGAGTLNISMIGRRSLRGLPRPWRRRCRSRVSSAGH